MKRNATAIIIGGLLILLGMVIVAKAFGLIDFNFAGWWTMFIIVPCLIGFVNGDGGRIGCLIGLGIGVVLLCCARDWIHRSMLFPVLLAIVLLAVGLGLIIGDGNRKKIRKHLEQSFYSNGANGKYTFHQQSSGAPSGTMGETNYTYNPQTNTYDTSEVHFTTDSSAQNTASGATGNYSQTDTNGGSDNTANFSHGSTYRNQNGFCVCTAVLSGRDIRYDGEVFTGGMISAVLGGIDLRLENAIVNGTVTLEVHDVLGGIDIYTPKYAKIIVNASPVLGSIDNATRFPQGANDQTPTIIINASCVLGGIEIK